MFGFQERLGFLRYQKNDTSIDSWYQLFVVASRLTKRQDLNVDNRRRIWYLCADLFVMVMHNRIQEPTEIENAGETYILQTEDRTAFLAVGATSQLRLEAPTLIDGTATKFSGTIDNITASGMNVSYKGDTRLRFVSGFEFLPSGEAIGNINRFDSRFVSFKPRAPTETLIMHVAANNYGIVDISVVSSDSPDPEPIWIGKSHLEGCAIKRWNMGPVWPRTTAFISQMIVELNSFSITSLQILRPSFIVASAVPAEQKFINQYFWKPHLPILNANMSLNHESFYQSSNLHFRLQDNPHPNPEFSPIEYIGGFETIARLSLWVSGLHNDICAIQIYRVESGLIPFVVGKPTGAATDIFINSSGGEYISGMSITVVKDSGQISGLSFSTSYNRKFNICCPVCDAGEREEAKTRIVDLAPNNKENTKIVGLYCRFGQRRTETTLLDIGVITVKLDRETQRPRRPIAGLEPANAQLVPSLKPRAGVFQEWPVGCDWKFTAETSLAGCKKVMASFQPQTPSRLSGIVLFYSNTEYTSIPKVLGHIGHTSKVHTLNIFSGQEIITKIKVFYKTLQGHSQKPMLTVGMKIQLTKGDEHSSYDLGDCEGAGDGHVEDLDILESDLIYWEYTEFADRLGVRSAL
ncbi:hypothetical protein TWF730_009106 [Orbilia blumenaviensis]|uniref:Uncharacterized protein n=1 Tax=Orbilia blumenaviensis TaxID=1796055 RepID=A0AAV9V3X8_9PEZI